MEENKRDKYIREHFPEVDYGSMPTGNHLIVQLRMVRKHTQGGIALPQNTIDFNKSQTCLGIVRAVGDIAYKSRETGEAWPEGPWCKPGDMVMVKKHEGRRFEVPIPGVDEAALFVNLYDYHIDSVVRPDFQDVENLYDNIV